MYKVGNVANDLHGEQQNKFNTIKCKVSKALE